MSWPPRLYSRFGKFNLVGLLGTGIQLLLFDLLIEGCGLRDVGATLIAVEITLLHNFLWHERLTWRTSRPIGPRQRVNRLWKFHASTGLASLAGNTVLTHLLVETLKAPPVLSSLAAIALCAPVNFVLADRWVFRSRAERQSSRCE